LKRRTLGKPLPRTGSKQKEGKEIPEREGKLHQMDKRTGERSGEGYGKMVEGKSRPSA
jgi:hypothetical protein